ncbi:hypothetical protein N0V84_007390 [Fusarium piperis]|uniref:Alpha/beta hydrolase fold-3 domain-containing protein n=1 Tax=Fusarium piperis TaxID=1435070 RepID=A0A9W8WA53_9HYPO|nr:hypothetical protein N0V84_007390 [Fusarium piperis]
MTEAADPGYPAPDLDPPQGSITVYQRSERYPMTRLLQTVIKPFRPALVKAGKIATEDSTRINAPKATLKRCHVDERRVKDLWVYDLTAKSTAKNTGKSREGYRRRIVYFAGGGWQMPPTNQHWSFCTELVSRMPDTKITIVSYPLAPTSPVSVAFPQIEKTYKAVLEEAARAGEAVVVAGDSSGGNIAHHMNKIWYLPQPFSLSVLQRISATSTRISRQWTRLTRCSPSRASNPQPELGVLNRQARARKGLIRERAIRRRVCVWTGALKIPESRQSKQTSAS